MSSGGWEVVGKNKKDKNLGRTNKLTKAEKKKFIENAPKVEDFLPLDQVKTLYDNLDGNKENKKPPKGKESKTKENEEKKKQQKQQQQQQQQQVEKKKEIPKEKPPKSIEEALRLINASEVEEILTSGQTRFPGAPLIWLKDLVAFLNKKIPLEATDPVFAERPEDYPASVVPKSIRLVLEEAIKISGSQNVQLFYEFNLTAMATDIVKNSPVVGYKIFIQLLAKFNPEMTITSIPKLVTLRNSYQNRKSIGLSLLWALSQSGKENLTVGLSVWHNVMAPMLEAKNYASYVSQILKDLITRYSNSKSIDVKADFYLNLVDVISGKLNIAPVYINETRASIDKLREMVLNSPNLKCRSFFETLMAKLTPKSNAYYRDEIFQSLVACLIKDPQCFSVWKTLYSKNLYQSDLLLKNINSHWNTLKGINKNNLFLELLEALQATHKKTKKNKDILAGECSKTCDELIKKMTASSSKGFPWKKGSFILLLLIGAILAFDCRKNGSFEASSTNKFLRESGILTYSQKAWILTKSYSQNGLKYIEASFPDYYKATVEFTAPYAKLGGDVYIVMKNLSIKLYENAATYVTEKTPVVVATIEHYAPGMLATVQEQSFKGIELIKKSSAYICEQVIDRSVLVVKWLETNVFVGKLSPKSLQSYASQAIGTTQTLASQTYDWVYEKVQTLSKVQ